jgi:hypothetical protein
MEERIKKLELITTRLSRRSKTHAKTLISPYPISNAVFGDAITGTILTYMFPCDGKIVKSAIDLGKKPRQEVYISISMMGKESGESVTMIMSKRRESIEPNIIVSMFDKLTIAVSYKVEKPEDALTEIWTSLLWVPTVKDVVAKSYLIEELENDILEKQQMSEEGLSGDSEG